MMLGEQRELNQLGCNYFAPSFDFLENHQESESEDACLASHATIPYHTMVTILTQHTARILTLTRGSILLSDVAHRNTVSLYKIYTVDCSCFTLEV